MPRNLGSPVAQSAERVAVNHLVAGSNPARGARQEPLGINPTALFLWVPIGAAYARGLAPTIEGGHTDITSSGFNAARWISASGLVEFPPMSIA
jgi:hypothetical protein